MKALMTPKIASRHSAVPLLMVALGVVMLLLSAILAARSWAAQAEAGEWRLRIREAAVVNGDTVVLGDIAEPYGPLSSQEWHALAARPLWSAPPEPGKPLQISRARLNQALRERLGDLTDRCLMPPNLAIQRGGAVLYEEDLRGLVVKNLSPTFNVLPGRVDVTDYRLPSYTFLAHAGQTVQVEPVKPSPGRISFRFQVLEVDGSVVRRFTGSAFINVWSEVACAARPYNRGDVVTPEGVTWISKNLAHVRGELWDGRGGPWQLIRPVGTGQPIFMTDLQPKSTLRRGDIVTLLFDKGNVRVSVQAEAMADGALGETIAVRNLQSKKQVFAVVRDSSTVVVK